MDPDKTLMCLRDDIETVNAEAVAYDRSAMRTVLLDIASLFASLDDWLSRGGFLPAAWATRDE